MNIFKWLASKAGKMPITIAQAAGITAVVGAAGFAAMSYLSSPADNNTAFIPPSAYEQQGDVVYISQGGGGGAYESNGEIQSSFHAKQSESIRLANAKFEREQRANALREAGEQTSYAAPEGDDPQTPKAYQMGAGDMDLGGGDTSIDKQLLNGGFDMANLQKEIPGLGNIVSNAQASAAQGGAQGAAGGAAGGSNPGAAKFSKASADYTRVAGGGGSSGSGGSASGSSYVIQNSGKNSGGKDEAAALAQAGNIMADAQAAMGRMQEGSRMRSSRASFGRSDGLGQDKDARGQGGRLKYGNAKAELAFIRKRSAEIDKNTTNAANAGGLPFLASNKITGGLTVDGEQVTTGQGSSSVDLNSTDRQMRGLKKWAGDVQTDQDKQKMARDELKQWMWTTFLAVAAMSLGIAILVKIARGTTLVSWPFWAAAAALTAAACVLTGMFFNKVATYVDVTGGHDKWSTIGYVAGGVFFVGIAAGWLYGLLGQPNKSINSWKEFFSACKYTVGGAFLGGGMGLYNMLSNKDQYLKEVEDAEKGDNQTQQQNEEDNKGGNK